MIKIAIDTGGTFTDYTAVGTFQNSEHKTVFVKNLTDHNHLAQGMIAGLKKLADAWHTDLETLLSETEQIIHGTTLALNALLEKKGAVTALFTTEGFRDALEIRRSQLENQWDLRAETPDVLVPRRLRLGIAQRMDYKGDILKVLDEQAVRNACLKCKAYGVQSIAVCYLFSFLNPEHEKRTAEIIREELPGVFVALSSDVAPKIREYERTSTTVLNAYLTPVLQDYLHTVKKELAQYGWGKPIHMMMNSGGLSDTDAMSSFAVKTLFSGPAGGACGNEAIGKMTEKPYTVLADMGGTSFDVHVSDSKNQLIPQSKIAGYPLSIPTIDITSIGAGGGSIARLDESGRLLVGPDSAGSVPGPACYGLGGTEPTVTDALVVLGLIDEDSFLGGQMGLNKKLAEKVIHDKVAAPLDISVAEGANIIYRIATEMMADAVRLVTIQKGNDPRKFSLIGAGGAFPLFAANMMDALHMKEVLFPVIGPVFCAWGMLGATRRCDFTRSFFMEKGQWDPSKINVVITDMKKEGKAELGRLGVPENEQNFRLTLEMRYIGQHHEIAIPWQGAFTSESRDALEIAFNRTHESIYEYAETDKEWEIINIHLACLEREKENTRFPFPENDILLANRTVAGNPFGQTGEISVPVYHAGDLTGNGTKGINGPALINFDYTTVLIPAGFAGKSVKNGVLSITKEGAEA
ncbi:N-methylhydantoinase A [Dehalobacter sp. DCA]|jgi:N-methylhydantoinase A/acetone carboxylase, beta subunit|uniref:hydantoinase/oxoprolinase family protein n=1 Tax=Dehalobacter sp. DCA TaxID=1147129 RepID=UPI00028B7FAF|nr:hydantoinase/oxoprolinase family protein [Dehalobacter sp. DCA]AFV02152.1 N-methylhydantoinase A [Dehalobacter sp. DCA]